MAKKKVEDVSAADPEGAIVVPVKQNPTLDYAKKRYEELRVTKAKLVKELQPFRDDYERLTNDKRLIQCRAKIKEMNAEIGPVDNELATLSKLFPGNTSMSRGE